MHKFLTVFVTLFVLSVSASAGTCAGLIRAMDTAPKGPVFLASYPTAPTGPLHDTAFVYDNAAAAIALVGCGRPDLGRRIGDALLYAQAHDRAWHDGRLRNAYAAGAIGPGPIKLAGWWEPKENRWVEDRYHVGSDTGNLAWAMLALLTLDETAPDRRFLAGAQKIGAFLETRRDNRGAGGFTGGTFGFEPTPKVYSWKSTEHNIDAAAAFARLTKRSGHERWHSDVQAATGFVQAMWQPSCACFAAGTGDDGVHLNPLVALDAQVWAMLAIGPRPIDRVLSRLATSDGYAYDETRGGVWAEGTAAVALLAALQGKSPQSDRLHRTLAALHRPEGVLAAAGTGAATGLRLATDPTAARIYFAMPHLGATAWTALAEQKFNPFTGTKTLP